MASFSYSDNIRKAEKKLREIDRLKNKTDRTSEEDEKIERETFYRRIIDPTYKTEDEKEHERVTLEKLQKERENLKLRQFERHQKKQKKKIEREEREEKKKQEEKKKP